MRNGYRSLSVSRVFSTTVLGMNVLAEFGVPMEDTEPPVLTWVSVPGPGPFVMDERLLRASWAVAFGRVTAPMPLMLDFTTGSSLVLSRTRRSMGIGCRMLAIDR